MVNLACCSLRLLHTSQEELTNLLSPCCWLPIEQDLEVIVLLQVFLALPSNCPTDPDGSSRSTDGQTKADSVVLYASADEAQTFEQVTSSHLCSTVSLHISRKSVCMWPRAPVWPVQTGIMQVCLPVKWLDLGYNLVKTHDGASAFLVVDHDEEDMVAKRAPMGNIYAPGEIPLPARYAQLGYASCLVATKNRYCHAGYNNTLYSLSMTMNFRRRYITDFGRIEGIPGVYMANQLSSRDAHRPRRHARPGF